jgi:ribosomal-protein-alanine N-acetyltransferase
MIEKDLDKVIEIEKNVFRRPWTKNFFRLIISDINNYVLTLKKGNVLIGYGGYHSLNSEANFLFRNNEYTKVIHLINIAIGPCFQHKGYGTFLMNRLLNSARARDRDYCYLEARGSNLKALSFYKKFGFSIIGIIENYYPQDREDALVLGKNLLNTPHL